ncbi:MAG: DUF2177 family protein, partial [Candidatus Shapirobacteria bacterium]|nr:DUF2177 family protein [Candidatus Shapirobacteria bacterium]
KPFYDQEFFSFSRTLRWPSAILVYFLIPLGLLLLVLPKTNGVWFWGLFWGAFYGLVVYGVYDLTNYAILADWTLKLTIVDILWGMSLNGLGGLLLVLISNWLR